MQANPHTPIRDLRDSILTRSWLAGGLFCLICVVVSPQSGFAFIFATLVILIAVTMFVNFRYPAENVLDEEGFDDEDRIAELYFSASYVIGDDGELVEIPDSLNIPHSQ
ncbi:MAG: hypothetical protein H7Y09_05515 [Chitinophagaceae bacterium]|nr:hypothetical protein [Anaerolineae bacterium]